MTQLAYSWPAVPGLSQVRFTLALRTLALAVALTPLANATEGTALDKIRQGGALKVALYKNYAPFSYEGKGIDVDIAAALAAKLQVKVVPVWFNSDEKLDDDLRKMVWNGTPFTSPADVMMHAPVDPQWAATVDKVRIIAPYHRERFAVARHREQLPALESLAPFEGVPFAVTGESMAGDVMLSADGGRYRSNARIFKVTEDAINALKSGAVAAAFAEQGELEAALRDDARFVIETPPHPMLKLPQWSVGLAVKSGSTELATALQRAMDELLADGTVARVMQKYGVKDRRP